MPKSPGRRRNRYSLQGFETAGYQDHFVLPIALPLARPGQALSLHAAVDYAACAQICVPYSAKFDLALPAGPMLPAPQAALIAAARARVPRSLAAAGIELVSVNAVGDGRDTSLIVRLQPWRRVSVARPVCRGHGAGLTRPPAVALSRWRHRARLTVPIRDAAAAGIAGGKLTLTFVDGLRAAEFAATPLAASGPQGDAGRLLPILAIALLGGLILNAMPCVLPVLSLKLLSVASQAGADRIRLRIGLLMTALGVLASFALIAATLIGLVSGAVIGWGIQFQWPWFIAAMAALTTMFAASLWGWLAIGLPRIAYDAAAASRVRPPYADAFLTGGFATLLATPCSAPFVGTAVGFALAQGPRQIAVVFAALGLGFAAPYLLVAGFPQLVRLLPRPGRWMNRLRAVLGLALAGTTVWLLFVLAALSGARVALAAAAALTIVLGLLALKHRREMPAAGSRLVSGAAAALIAAAILWPAFAGVAGGGVGSGVSGAGPWRRFDARAIPRLVGEGKTVFVDVSGLVLDLQGQRSGGARPRAGSGRLFGSRVVAMRGDSTRPDPALARYLQSFGRYGVPFNAVYGPGRPDGELLPELLTSAAVENALDRAAARTTASR